MKVFVTGATGFVGDEITRELIRAGHSACALVRDRRTPLAREALARGLQLHAGNILDAESLRGAMAGIDAVIHLVGIISEVGQSTFENIHTRGVQNVLAAAKMGGVRRFVHMSALGTRPNAAARYHRSKWAAEESVRQSGLDFTIFRPSLIYGPHDHFVNLFAKITRRSPILPIMGSGKSRFEPVFIGSVARAFVTALISPAAIGQTYDLCGSERFTFGEMLDQILTVMARKRWKVRVPLGLARLQARVLEFMFPRLLRRAPPLNRDQLTMLQEDNVGNGQPANELFDLKQVKFAEAIATYLRPGA